MADFKQTYRTGRSVLHIVAYFGWCVAAVGLVVFGAGVSALLSGTGLVGGALNLVTIASGLTTLLVGLGGVGAAQGMQAGFDTADMTREMLSLARKSSAEIPAPRSPKVATLPVESTADGRPTLSGNRPLRTEAAPRPEPALRMVPKTRAAPTAHPIFSAKPPG